MKKFISFCTVLSLLFSLMIVTTNAEEKTPILKSFEIVDFKNEFNSGSEFDIDYELNKEVDELSFNFVYYIKDKGTKDIYVDSASKILRIDEKMKHEGEFFDLLYFYVNYSINDEYYTDYYSKYTAEEINEIQPGFISEYYTREVIQSNQYDYSFKLLNYEEKTPILKSLELVDFKNEFNSGTNYIVNYELYKEVENLSLNFVYFVDDKEIQSFYVGELSGNKLRIEEEMKYIGANYKFLYLETSYTINDEYYTDYYSKYTAQEIDEIYENFIGEDIIPDIYQNDQYEYSFKLLNANVDTIAPEMHNFEFTQNKDSFNISFNGRDNLSGINEVIIRLSSDAGYLEFYVYDFIKENGLFTAKQTLQSWDYQYNEYGTYKITEVVIVDKVANERSYTDIEGTFELKKEDNVLENITQDDIFVETAYVDNKVYFRKDTGFGQQNAFVHFRCKNSHGTEIFLDSHTFSKDEVDISTIGSKTFNIKVNVDVHLDERKEFILPVEVEVVDIIGKVVRYDHVKEISQLYDENIPLFTDNQFITVLLNTGEYKQVPVKQVAGGGGIGNDEEDGMIVATGGKYVYNPKYELENDTKGFIETKTIYHLVDKQGNLVNKEGKILVHKKDRKNWDYSSKNQAITLSSLYGSLPSYTEVEAVENHNLNNVFKNQEYIAYDINLKADNFDVQPVENVQVGIALPNNLKNKELEIYYVDDQNNTKLISDSMIKDGQIIFNTDHFSTYAVVEKKNNESVDPNPKPVDPIIPDKPTEPETPNTSDYTNLWNLSLLLILSSIALLSFYLKKHYAK